jgi:hypothetical protein
MKKILSLTLAGLLGCLPAMAFAAGKSLCNANETAVFQCRMKDKLVSRCASRDFSGSNGTLQYRFGLPDKVELNYPQTPQPAQGHFHFSRTAYSGGGATHIRFTNLDYEYILFERTIRTGFGSGPNNPEFSAGVITRHSGETSTRKCSDDASINAEALEAIPAEEFEDIE